MTRPLENSRSPINRVTLVGSAAAATCAIWAFWPSAKSTSALTDLRVGTTENPLSHPGMTTPAVEVQPIEPLDLDAFRVPLWVIEPPPPPPPPTPKPEPPPPPLKLQLVSILAQTSPTTPQTTVYQATFYDPDQDRLLVVSVGDLLDPTRKVTSMNAQAVTLQDGKFTRTITLREPEEPLTGDSR